VLDVLVVLARAVAFAAIVVTTGAVVFRWGVLQRWPAPRPEPFAEWSDLITRSAAWAAACLTLVEPVRLYAQARSLVDAGDPALPMMANVLRTVWGRGWMLQTGAALAALAGLLLVHRGARAGWWLTLAASLGLTLSPALMGHAVAARHLLLASLLADWIHVAMAGAWLGALAMLAFIACTTTAAASDDHTFVATLIELFHPVARAAAMVLIVTGVISLLLRVDHLRDLLHSTYGAILAVKLALTLGVAGLGANHAMRGAQRARARGNRAVVGSLVAETVLAAAVIAATAVLVGVAPPMGMAMGAP
jgi:putative copper export protein